MHDRRRNVRARVPLVATAFAEGKRIGDYLIRNLSAGGALLFNGPPLPVDKKVGLLLQGALPHPFSLTCTVIRSHLPSSAASVAVAFGALSAANEDLLHDLVLRSLEDQAHPAVLVVLRRPHLLASLASELSEVGHSVVLAMTEDDATSYLDGSGTSLAAVVVDVAADPLSAFWALELVEKRFPKARRVALCDQARTRGMARAFVRGRAHAVLDFPWTRKQLRSTLPVNMLADAGSLAESSDAPARTSERHSSSIPLVLPRCPT